MRIPFLTYIAPLALASFAGAQGTDSCTTPTPITGNGPFAFNSSSATNTTSAGQTCAGLGRDLFWVWTAPSTGGFSVSTCGGASFDSVIAVYAGSTCPSPAGAYLACNDDSCGLQSAAGFNAIAGAQYLIRIGSFNGGAGGAGSFTIGTGGGGGCPTPSSGPDVIVGQISDINNYPITGSLDAVSLGTVSCNIGDQNLNWVASTPEHPVIGGNLYRYSVVGGAGRFEQIGQSWLKHGFTALTGNLCCPCNNPGTGSLLGVGCSDPYGAGLNGSQGGLGPRWQVNAHTGVFTYPPANPSWSGNAARRLEFDVNDGAVTAGGTTRFFGETQYVTHDDATAGHQNNNASWLEMACSGSTSDWNFNFIGGTHREESAIRAWAAIDPAVTLTDVQVSGDGLYIIGSRATDLGGGQWRYEFAAYNMNGDRNVGSFSVPVGTATVTNIGFHDVTYRNGDGPGHVNFSGTDWPSSISAGTITWATQTQAANASANAIRWASTYNFRFDANVAPTSGNVTLGLWKTGSPGSATAAAQIPNGAGSPFTPFCFGDGLGGTCPCLNFGATGNGCASSVNANGANLAASGTPSVAADTMVLSGTGMPNSSALYFQGTTQLGGGFGSPFGDGLRCAGGSVIRLGTKINAGGASQYPQGGDLSISVKGAVAAGNVRTYQSWYRNAAAFCMPETFNLSNGISCTWAP